MGIGGYANGYYDRHLIPRNLMRILKLTLLGTGLTTPWDKFLVL
jgi:hypothetical protein